MSESAKSYISRAADVAFRNDSKTTMGEVAIAKSNLEIADAVARSNQAVADALVQIAQALAPRPAVIEVSAPVDRGPSDEEVGEPKDAEEAYLTSLIEHVDEESGYQNIFHAEAVLVARALLAAGYSRGGEGRD